MSRGGKITPLSAADEALLVEVYLAGKTPVRSIEAQFGIGSPRLNEILKSHGAHANKRNNWMRQFGCRRVPSNL